MGRPRRRATGSGSRPAPILARDAVRRVRPRPRRPHAARPDHARRPRPRTPRTPAAAARQAGDAQPGRLGQGPDRPADDRGRRAGGPAQAGRHDHRADVGQHRPRPGHRRGPQGLPLHLRDGRQAVVREAAAAAGLRRRGRPVPDQRRARVARVLLQRGGPAGARHPGRLQAGPVLEHREPGRPRADHRARALGADGRADHPPRRERRDRRDDLGGGPLPQGPQPGDPDHRRRSRGERPVRRHRPALSHRGDRRGLLPRHLRRIDGGRVGPGERPRRLRDGAPHHPRGGHPVGRIVRDGDGRRAQGRPGADAGATAAPTRSSSSCCPTAAGATCPRSTTTSGCAPTA